MKRHHMKGQPASHGVTKTHRKMGASGGGGVSYYISCLDCMNTHTQLIIHVPKYLNRSLAALASISLRSFSVRCMIYLILLSIINSRPAFIASQVWFGYQLKQCDQESLLP